MSMRSPSIVARGALLIALPCLVFTGCKEKQPESAPVTASVVAALRTPLANTLTVAGEFLPYQEVELHAKVAGYIRHINVDIGDKVKQGQVLATLDVPELQAQVQGAQAGGRQNEAEVVRAPSDGARGEANYAALHSAAARLKQASD